MLHIFDTIDLAEYALSTIFRPSEKPSPVAASSPPPSETESKAPSTPQASLFTSDNILSTFLPISLPPDVDDGQRLYMSSDEEWRRCDKRARNTILLNIADLASFGLEGHDVRSAVDVWSRLRLAFEIQDPAVVQHMRSQITSTRIDPSSTSITSHFKTLWAFRDRANRAGARWSEAEFWSLSSQSFPLQGPFGPVLWTLMSCQSSIPAETILIAAEEHLIVDGIITHSLSSTPNMPSATALVVNGRNFPNSRPRCTHCKNNGHFAEDCYEDGGAAADCRPEWWSRKRGLLPGSNSPTSHISGNSATPSDPSATLAIGPVTPF
ncbi:uncharacterized protein STEHIDRAFT_112972 [Stereum hirsutum FP-91666 SS1]|uniref:uncharacterized protein n=1 Tax=Stereum hirsutum (strain FP-91666) TaxID=721885 RepID=UPI0004449A74|nr:uncharacterized protein STEHIDRAFT_112972 [Stereum hirsutum FP-91666 SS1]EIM83686.1 hypothetical protein STEHIDRAFT_112972 [Stereum hirsutum FP-91666 SS1]